MNRREFMTRFGMAAMAAGVAPSLMGLSEQPQGGAGTRAWAIESEEQEVPCVMAPALGEDVEILSLMASYDPKATRSEPYVIQLRRPGQPFNVVYETYGNVLTPFEMLFGPVVWPVGRVEVMCTRDVPWCLFYRPRGGGLVNFIAGGLRT